MCGIAGIWGEAPDEVLDKMLERQQHRGPDNRGVWRKPGLQLGHNRLSIIDLSAAGHQPMISADGRYMLVFNGEIYNYLELRKRWLPDYAFQSASDTEVLLALWGLKGKSILAELLGMFAFAIYDVKEHCLTLVRDRFGVKPCYYASQKEVFYFASEINPLWAAGIEKIPKQDVWAGYFAGGNYGNPDESFWEGIHQLPAGHLMEINAGGVKKPECWYPFVENIGQQPIFKTDQDLHDAYMAILKSAISLRFRSDVPVGFTLSGGLDSSILLAGIHQLFPDEKSIKAFTFVCDHPVYDELHWAKLLVAHTQKPLEPVMLSWQDVPEKAAAMALLQAEPYGAFPTLAYAGLFNEARNQGYKVLLDGQGMDEAWAGYDYYLKDTNHLVQGSNGSPVKPKTLNPDFLRLQESFSYPEPFNNRLQNLQYRDLFYTKIPRAVRFNDRASMMSSVELREPFLDHRLVEMAFAQPREFKIRAGQRKWMLRQMAAEWLGDDIAFAPKRAIQTPQREWLRHELKDWANEQIEWLLCQGNPGWFEAKEVRLAWKNYANGEGDNSFFIWQWINTAMLLSAK